MTSWVEQAVLANLRERKEEQAKVTLSQLVAWPECLKVAGLPPTTARATIRKYMAQGAFPEAIRRGLGPRARLEWKRTELMLWRRKREGETGEDLV